MPAKNSLKTYVENGYYHLYNRGVEKRKIFLDSQDYAVCLTYLKEYLLPKDTLFLQRRLANEQTSYKEKDKIIRLLRLNNFSDQLDLMAHALMPNHFHFLVRQKDSQIIDSFMQSLLTRYTMYFNKKYKRVGSLFQSVYKAVLLDSEAQFLHLTRYIHRQALASKGETLRGRYPSSYEEYIGTRNTPWVKPDEILKFFSKNVPSLSYESFVKQGDDAPELLKNVTLED